MEHQNTHQLNLRLQKLVTIVAVVLFIIKIFAWYLTESVAILTDALESTVNVIAGFISLYGLYIAGKPRDKDHPYGHGKAEFISAAVEGSMIMIAGFVIIYESINNFIHPHELKKLDYGLILVGVTAIVNYLLGWYCVNTGKRNHSLALIASGKHLQSDTYSTLGILVGLGLILIFGWNWLDSAVAILFAFIILFTGYQIIRRSLAGIMDEADRELLKDVVQMLNSKRKENWIDLHNLRIIKFGSILHLDCHLTLPWYLNVREANQEIDLLSDEVKQAFGESVELFVHSDGCVDFSCKICNLSNCGVRQHPFERKVEWTVDNISTNNKHQI